ncbi:MAG: transcriptional regulator [Sphingomonadales bacterium]|nr:MAG: transcriptional regulator [Sphingomonadales bacterium]
MKERLLNRVRDKREQHGLTQAELAYRVGVSRKTINTIENLVFFPSALLAIRIARCLEVGVEELFWIEGDGTCLSK